MIMQKVYLLLRSNQQTGPYSLEELLQFDLKPFDLIWIEGRSAGWYYPQEIPALQPHLSFLKQTQASTPAPVQESVVKPVQSAGPKKVFVSMPSNASKEDPTPKPSFSSEQYYEQERPTFPPSSSLPKEEPAALKTTYAKSLDEVETDYTNWLYQKKTKKKPAISPKAVFLACLLVGSAYAAWTILQPGDDDSATTMQQQSAQVPVQNELGTDSVEETTDTQTAGKSSVDSKQKQKKNTVIPKEEKPLASKSNPREQVPTSPVNAPKDQEVPPTSEVNDETVTVEEKKPEPVTAEAPKEKKKLKDKIADLFRKKPEEKKEEARPSEEENGERRSVRREAGSSLAQMVTVGFDIPNDWMMGIKGAKATLTNRSSETIAKAVVEVVYYNDDNDVLDKRTISFSNIKSKQKQTVSVPDHQTATRLEYNVISATGAGEPFAKR